MAAGCKAQSSMEYLMTYGWAVLVVLVVGVILWEVGIFDTSPKGASFTGFAKLKPQLAGTGITQSGYFRGVFTNGMGGKVVVTAVRVRDMATGNIICCSHEEAGTGCNDAASNVGGKDAEDFMDGPTDETKYPKVPAGDIFLVDLGRDPDNLCSIPNALFGGSYNVGVEIDYLSTSGRDTVPHTDSGVIRGALE